MSHPSSSLQNQEPTIIAFADDSVTAHSVTCGVLVLPAARVSEAETILATAKAVRGVSPKEAIHCTDLFSQRARQKTAWRSLTRAAVQALIEAVCEDLRVLSYQPIVCWIDRATVPPDATKPGSILEGLNAKGIATHAYVSVFRLLADRYTASAVQVFIDPESTRIPWGPGSRRKAELTRSIRLDLGERSSSGLFVPHVGRNPKPRLLEVADIYAYATARARGPAQDPLREWFRTLYLSIAPQGLEFTFSPTQVWDKTAEHLRQNPR